MSDVPEILAMIHELAEYERAADMVEATEAKLLSTLTFADKPGQGYAKTLLAFPPGSTKPVGMALYFHNYSTWNAAPGIFLEDLYVKAESRNAGHGKALLKRLAEETVKVGGKRLEWSVLKWNQPSIEFYERIGATRMEEWVGYRLEGDALAKMGAPL